MTYLAATSACTSLERSLLARTSPSTSRVNCSFSRCSFSLTLPTFPSSTTWERGLREGGGGGAEGGEALGTVQGRVGGGDGEGRERG